MKRDLSLSTFERWLWAGSAAAVTVSFLLVLQKDWLSLIASLIGVTALLFVAKGQVIGQILTVVFAVFYGILSWGFRYYGEVITYLCMTAPMAVMAIISWLRHPYEGAREVRVSPLTPKKVAVMALLAGAVTAVFYVVLKALGNHNLPFSTLSVTTSFVASYLTFLRSPFYAVGYAANDLVLIVLWVLAALEEPAYTPMIACFVVFFVNDVYGFVNWRRMQKRQTP